MQEKNQLLECLKRYSPNEFEKFVLEFLKKIENTEYGEVTGRAGDEGIDGFIRLDKLGLGDVFFQAKRWDATVIGRPEIQKFVGALHGKKATSGIFVTISSFTREAREYIQHIDTKVRLIDGNELAELLLVNGLQNLIKKDFSDQKISLDEAANNNKFVTEDSEDYLYDQAVEIVARARQASTSLLQRRLMVGYSRAARLLDDMEMRGVVGPADGNKPRKILVPIPGGSGGPLEEDEETLDEKLD